MIRRLLFSILVCLLFATNAHAQIDYYLPPSAKVSLDSNVWKYNTYNPSFLAVARYFKNQRDSIVNKNDGMIVYFEPVFFTQSVKSIDESEYRKPTMLFDKLIIADSYYARNQYYFICDSLAGVKLTFNRTKEELLNNADVKKLVQSLEYVDVKTIDKAAGYPLKPNVNRDSLFIERKNEFYTYFNGNRKEIYVEHLFLLDADLDFSFEKWKEYSIKDNTFNYSDCELALADSKLGLPESASWLLTFTDDYKVNVRRDDDHYLRDKYKMQSKERYFIEKLSRSYNKIGIAYACYKEDPDEIELKSFLRDKNGDCHECSLKIQSNIYSNYGNYKEGLIGSNGNMNKEAWSYYPVDNRFNEFIVEVYNEELAGNTKCRSFSSRYLMSTSVPLESPIEFGFPDSDKGWQAIFDCDFVEEQKEYLIDETARFALGAVSSITLPSDFVVSYSSCSSNNGDEYPLTALSTRMYRAPLLYGDFNKNGQLEFVNLFIQSGGIVFTEVFEKDSVTIKKIPCTLSMTRELLSLPVIQKILVISTVSTRASLESIVGVRFRNSNDAVGEYYDEVVSEEPYGYDSYGGYDAVMEISPAVEDGYYSGYSNSRSMTYIESGVEVKAEFPGGEKAMKKYIKKNLNYPFRKKLKDEVIVKVGLKITSEGKVEITYASSSPTQYQEYFIEEAKRLCSEMPNWSPAELNGIKVNMEKILYITF
jgi:hypothetical protein